MKLTPDQLRTEIDHARQQIESGDIAPLNADDIILKARRQYAEQSRHS